MKSLFACMLLTCFGGGLHPRHYIDISIMYIISFFFINVCNFIFVEFIPLESLT